MTTSTQGLNSQEELKTPEKFGRPYITKLIMNDLGIGYAAAAYVIDFTIDPELKARERSAEENGVAWTISVIDDLHIHRDYDLNSETDKMFKGIKNTIRDRYKFMTEIDPAPSYPINATLLNRQSLQPKKGNQ
jgi:hypothetical protein